MQKNKAGHRFQILQVLWVCSDRYKNAIAKYIAGKGNKNDKQVKYVLNGYMDVFGDDLPDKPPPQRSPQHSIIIEENEKAPHRGLFQLAPAKHWITKKYAYDLFQKRKCRTNKSPYRALFFKHKYKLHRAAEYRALNRITKQNSFPLHRPMKFSIDWGGRNIF